MIISVAAAHVRLIIFPRHLLFRQKLSCSKQGSKKHVVCDIRREGSKKAKADKFIILEFLQKLQILAIFGDPRNIIPSKIPCLTVVS